MMQRKFNYSVLVAVLLVVTSLLMFSSALDESEAGIPPTPAFDTIIANGTSVIADVYNDIMNVTSDGSILITGTNYVGGSPYSAWSYKKSITLDSSMIDADMTDFPALVMITDSDLSTYAQPDGDDILFTLSDEMTKIPHEIESYNSTSGELIAWVKTDVEDLTDTELFMFFGNPGASDQQDIINVWDDNYLAVYHFESLLDSTQYNHDLTNSGATQVDANIGHGYSFDGIADYLTDSDWYWLASDPDFTFEGWNYWPASSTSTPQALWGWGYVTPDRRVMHAPFNPISGDDRADLFWALDSSNLQVADYGANYGDGYSHLAVTNEIASLSPNRGEYFINGTDYATGGLSAPPEYDSTTVFEIARWGGFYQHEGTIDEFRFSNIHRSNEYITTNYNIQSNPSSFVTVGVLEAATGTDEILFTLNAPSGGILGGVFSGSCSGGEAITAINTNGSITCTVVNGTGGGGGGTHTLLNATSHIDTVNQSVTRGSIIYGDSTPKWNELVIGSNGQVLSSNGIDVFWNLVGSEQTEDDLITGQTTLTGTSPSDDLLDYILISDNAGGLKKIHFTDYMETISQLTAISPASDDELIVYDTDGTTVGRISISELGAPFSVLKTDDESVTSSTTLQNDDHISFPVESNSRYHFIMTLAYNAGTTGDVKIGWSVPTGTIMHRMADAFTSPNDFSETDTLRLQGSGASNSTGNTYGTIHTAGTAGTMQMQWAQQSSDVTPSTIYEGSGIIIWKLS